MKALKLVEGHVVTIGKRSVSAVGWRTPIVWNHLRNHAAGKEEKDRWCTVECLARSMFQRNTEKNRHEVRKRVRGLFGNLLQAGIFVGVDYSGPHGQIQALKILDPSDESDRLQAQMQLERMERRAEITSAMLQTARGIVGASPGLPRGEPGA